VVLQKCYRVEDEQRLYRTIDCSAGQFRQE
jgi:hypothetical protein